MYYSNKANELLHKLNQEFKQTRVVQDDESLIRIMVGAKVTDDALINVDYVMFVYYNGPYAQQSNMIFGLTNWWVYYENITQQDINNYMKNPFNTKYKSKVQAFKTFLFLRRHIKKHYSNFVLQNQNKVEKNVSD